jgi:hypothetical protein
MCPEVVCQNIKLSHKNYTKREGKTTARLTELLCYKICHWVSFKFRIRNLHQKLVGRTPFSSVSAMEVKLQRITIL